MSPRAAARLAWLLCALSLALTVLSLLLLGLNLSHPDTNNESTMKTIWWMCSLPGGNPPTRCAVQNTG